MTAVHKHAKANRRRTAKVQDGAHGSQSRTARVEHVIHENDRLAFHRSRHFGKAHFGRHLLAVMEVVTVIRGIEATHFNGLAKFLGKTLGELFGERNSAACHAEHNHVVGGRMHLRNLRRHFVQRKFHRLRRKKLAYFFAVIVHKTVLVINR